MWPPSTRTVWTRVLTLSAGFAVVATLTLSGCAGPDKAGDRRAAEQPSPRPATNSPETVSAPTPSTEPPGELTAEEDLANNPPPPTHVRVLRASNNAVVIAWDPPPAVTVPHHYSDHVVAYRVYRRTGHDVDFRPLATTTQMTYTDQTVTANHTYEYIVSSIREHHAEGSRSDPPAEATTTS